MDTAGKVNFWLTGFTKIGLAVVILTTLFGFWDKTTDFYETPKLIVLAVFVAVLLILTSLKFVLSDKVSFLATPLDIPLILLLAVAVVSTILSPSPLISVFGNQPTPHWGLASIIIYILLYLTLTNSLKGEKDAKFIVTLLNAGGVLLALTSLASYFGVKFLSAPFGQTVNFTPSGSPFSTTAILAMILPFSLLILLQEGKSVLQHLSKTIQAVLFILFGVTIILTGPLATQAAALIGVAIVLSLTQPSRLLKNLPYLAVPITTLTLVGLLSYLPSLPGVNNPLYSRAQAFPREIQLDFQTSWKVSVSAFRDSPFWGTGPDSFLSDFTQYKPIEFNNNKLWNIRFDSAFNEYLGALATLGGVGLVALLVLTVVFLSSAITILVSQRKAGSSSEMLSSADLNSLGVNLNRLVQTSEHTLRVGLAISGILFFIILALHASTPVVWFGGILILVAFVMSIGFVKPLSINLKPLTASQIENFDILPGLILAVTIALMAAGAFFGGKYILADIHHRNAIKAVSQNNGLLAYNELVAAEKLAPWNDLYRIDLAQTNFALANAIVQNKVNQNPGDTNPLTDQDKQNIQTLLQQAIAEGKQATELNPKSPVNWEILAVIYRQIAGVAQNALVFSLDAYGRAIQRDPYNPILRLNVGGVYYSIKNYDLAIRFFTDAINLKPDWANGYYNLSVALKDKGDLTTALAVAEKMITLVESNSPDYQTASNYLNDLKSKTNPPTEIPPAAKESGSALEKKELPQVLDLPKPDKIATPEAIKKPSPTPSPQP